MSERSYHGATSRSLYCMCYVIGRKGRKEMFYLTTHLTHFIYAYMTSDIWQSTTQIVREETRWSHMGYSFRLAARVLLYASSHRQDDTYHGLCYTSRGAFTNWFLPPPKSPLLLLLMMMLLLLLLLPLLPPLLLLLLLLLVVFKLLLIIIN